MRNLLVAAMIVFTVMGCGDDDGIPDVQLVPPRLLADQVSVDNAAIQEFLRTHTFNYEEFANPPADFDFKVRIDTLDEDNADRTPFAEMDDLRMAEINVSSNAFPNLAEEETDISHTYYYLVVRQGQGRRPTVGDSTLLKFEGSLLNRTKFDATNTFLWQQLPNTVRGYGNGVSQITSGTLDGLTTNTDGTSSIENSGIGIIIMPSGLGFFNAPPLGSGIPPFSPLIFAVEVGLFVEDTDSDNDGIPNLLEDLNNNGFLLDDNTDFEQEQALFQPPMPNFQDADDDQDDIPTRDEIIINPDGTITFPDSDGDGVADYLDADS